MDVVPLVVSVLIVWFAAKLTIFVPAVFAVTDKLLNVFAPLTEIVCVPPPVKLKL